MIFVVVGLHPDPFDRLVAAAEAHGARSGEEVVVQGGTSLVPTPHCTFFELLPPQKMEELVAAARVVVTHGGPATIFLVEEHGKIPIVVPRRHEFDEHVDDHQVDFVRHLSRRVHLLENPAQLSTALAKHEMFVADPGRGGAQKTKSADFSRRFGDLVETVIAQRSARRSFLRATVRTLVSFLR
ncbi:MAG: multidrug MFS transporter [Proteobacteria bacterium]|nr:multidrug MFS transporter [Pseudomonadota bacterium]